MKEILFSSLLGAGAALPLLVGAWIALRWKAPDWVVGYVSAFGAGALISAIAYELVQDASEHADAGILAGALAAGAVTYFAGSRFLQSRGKAGGKSARGLALLMGAALDGIPEAFILGTSVIAGAGISFPFLVAVVVYAVSTLLLPWLAGFDPFDRGMFARLRDGDGICESRRALWSNVLDLIAVKPWLGWGWGELDYAHYMTLFNSVRFCEILDNAHNLPLHLAVELGVPLALLVCGGMAWWAWRRKPWQEADPARQMAWGVLAVIGLHSLLEYPLWYGPFQMAAGLCVVLLWSHPQPRAGAFHISNRPLAPVILAQAAIILIATSIYAAWDYHRISQLYLAPQDRDESYVNDTIGKARNSWLYSNQVQFAELTTTPLDRSTAQYTFDTASHLLHYSPEPRIIEKVIESAVMLGRDEEALAHLARYRAAFPKEHAAWARGNARMPAVIDGLSQSR